MASSKSLGPHSRGAVQGRSTFCHVCHRIPKDPDLNRSSGSYSEIAISIGISGSNISGSGSDLLVAISLYKASLLQK